MVAASGSISGPGVSDSISWRPPTRRRGRTASASTTMPMPPIHWLNWRQSMSERSTVSYSIRTVAPVVVIPDIASKSASTGWSSCTSLEKTYGSETAAAPRSHVSDDDEEPFADADVLAPLCQRADRHSGAGGDRGRRQERHRGLRVQDRDDRREDEREREVAKERSDEIERRAHVDVHTHAAAKTRPLHVERRLVGEPDYEAPRGEPEEGLEPTTYRLQGGCSTS